MDDAVSLTQAQRANLSILLLMREAALRDPGGAVCSFGVGKPDLDAILSLSPDQLVSFVCGMGNQALFLPRADLPALLNLPPAVSPVVASARAPRLPPLPDGPNAS